MGISEKNEIKAKNKITFGASRNVNGSNISSVAMTTVAFENGRNEYLIQLISQTSLVTPKMFLHSNSFISLINRYAD